MTIAPEKTRELYERDELPEEFSWVNNLAPRHQRIFYGEVQLEWSRYCLTNDPVPLEDFFADWQATAEVDSSAAHAAFLLHERPDDEYEEWAPGATS